MQLVLTLRLHRRLHTKRKHSFLLIVFLTHTIYLKSNLLNFSSSSAQEAQNNAAEAAAHANLPHETHNKVSQSYNTDHSQASYPDHSQQQSYGDHSVSASSEVEVAANHNYGEFKPSNHHFSLAGY